MTRDKKYWEEQTGKWMGEIGFPANEDPDPPFIVMWDYIGEGFTGDYNPDDPEDWPLLRFTVMVRNPDALYCEPPAEPPSDMYLEAANGSYCTASLPIDVDKDELEYYTEKVMIPKLAPLLAEGKSIKRLCEGFSHTGEGEIEEANRGNIIHLTHHKEFFTTGAYLYGVKINGHKLLIVSELEADTYCEGEECNDRVEKEYGL